MIKYYRMCTKSSRNVDVHIHWKEISTEEKNNKTPYRFPVEMSPPLTVDVLD